MSDTSASNNRESGTLTVDAMRNKLDAILNLVNVWVHLNEEKTRYENTQRKQEIDEKLFINAEQFEELVKDVEHGAELLKELSAEFNRSVPRSAVKSSVYGRKRS